MITIDNLLADTLTATSSLDIVEITTDASRVEVTMWVNGEQLITNTYYPYDGKILIYGYSDIIEQHMICEGMPIADVTIDLSGTADNDTVSVSFPVMYCREQMSCSPYEFVKNNFLTNRRASIVPPRASFPISFIEATSNDVTEIVAHCTYSIVGETGLHIDVLNVQCSIMAYAGDYMFLQRYCSLVELKRQILDQKPGHDIALHSITFTVGYRALSYFIDDDSMPNLNLSYRNNYNVYDNLFLNADIAIKTDLEGNVATTGNTITMYDNRTEETCEAECPGLLCADALLMRELIKSEYVYQITDLEAMEQHDSVFERVLITDSECNVKNINEELNTIKLTIRYSNRRKLYREVYSGKMFKDEYNNTFN